jgi:plasmid stabilization system protein ParE
MSTKAEQILADRFVSELRRYIEAMAERPQSYPEHATGVRRANLRRFPYHVLFRILDDESIKILAIKHNRRHPSLATRRR